MDGRMVLGLDFIQLVITAQNECHQWLWRAFFSGTEHDQRFDGAFCGQAEEVAYRLDGSLVRRIYQRFLFGGSGTLALWWEGGGFLDVGGVAASVGKDDGIFTGISEHMEFVGPFATDGA